MKIRYESKLAKLSLELKGAREENAQLRAVANRSAPQEPNNTTTSDIERSAYLLSIHKKQFNETAAALVDMEQKAGQLERKMTQCQADADAHKKRAEAAELQCQLLSERVQSLLREQQEATAEMETISAAAEEMQFENRKDKLFLRFAKKIGSNLPSENITDARDPMFMDVVDLLGKLRRDCGLKASSHTFALITKVEDAIGVLGRKFADQAQRENSLLASLVEMSDRNPDHRSATTASSAIGMKKRMALHAQRIQMAEQLLRSGNGAY